MTGGSPFLSGFALSAALIVAIGAQNSFVLRQGLRREHVAPIVVACTLADVTLMGAGVAGLGAALRRAVRPDDHVARTSQSLPTVPSAPQSAGSGALMLFPRSSSARSMSIPAADEGGKPNRAIRACLKNILFLKKKKQKDFIRLVSV